LEHATLLHRLYRSTEASPLWERLIAHPDATPAHWLAAAKMAFQAGRFAASSRFTAKALAACPDSADIAAMHASALERSGDRDQAAKVAADLLGSRPGHARLVRQLAHLERLDGQFAAAKDRLEGQLLHHPGEEDWRLRYELAAVLDRLGEFGGAMRELELAKQQLAPESAKLRPAWRAMTGRQWEVTRSLSAERLERWQVPISGVSRRICLLAGFPRSGTTLLEKILTTHPDCIGTDESGVLATQFRDPVIFGAASASAAIGELDALESDDLAAGRDEYFRCTEDLLGEQVGRRLLIEKEPLMTADLALPLRLFPEARILMPLRDPRDVVLSFFFTIVPLAPNSVAAFSMDDSCRYYGEVMRHWLLLRERLDPGRWMESRYEDLLADPGRRTRQLADFLGIGWQPELLAHHRGGGRAIGTPTYDDVSRPLYTRSLERWRNYGPWLEPHLHQLQPFMNAFGYR
jgi:tetratricopeptide (TPR) repeat protein